MEDVLKPPGSLLATDHSKAVVLVSFLLNVFGVGVSCRKLYSFVVWCLGWATIFYCDTP